MALGQVVEEGTGGQVQGNLGHKGGDLGWAVGLGYLWYPPGAVPVRRVKLWSVLALVPLYHTLEVFPREEDPHPHDGEITDTFATEPPAAFHVLVSCLICCKWIHSLLVWQNVHLKPSYVLDCRRTFAAMSVKSWWAMRSVWRLTRLVLGGWS
jgi:hypothetical protein